MPTKVERNLGLDLLRILAVFLVLGRHMHLPTGANVFLKTWHRGGWVGVDLFFVLSGFLVSKLLFQEYVKTGHVDVRRFLIRRGFKIYPAFWVFISYSLLSRPFDFANSQCIRNLLGELFFLQNYFGAMWKHTWSLAVEEHFYIAIAIFFGMRGRKSKIDFTTIPLLFVIVALSCLLLRILSLFVFHDFNWRAHVFATHIRLDSLFYGLLLAYLCQFHEMETRLARVPCWLLLLSGCLLLSPAFYVELGSEPLLQTVGFSFFYIGSGLLLLCAIRLRNSRKLSINTFASLGASSYSIYLWHVPFNHWTLNLTQPIGGTWEFIVYFAFYILGTCLFGVLMSRLIEVPALKFRELVFPSRVDRITT